MELGVGTELAKADTKTDYQLVLLHPNNCPLLAMHWKGEVYIDMTLLFGLR